MQTIEQFLSLYVTGSGFKLVQVQLRDGSPALIGGIYCPESGKYRIKPANDLAPDAWDLTGKHNKDPWLDIVLIFDDEENVIATDKADGE